jgi:chloramphenicol-sensitive protein RarD
VEGRIVTRGVLAAVFSSVIFASLYSYATLLDPLTGEEIFAWRLLFTAPGATILLLAAREWWQVKAVYRRLLETPARALIYLANAAMLGVQMWVFMWAPLHGRGLEVTLGYFLMPLVLVVIGRVVYKDRISRWQLAATLLAAVGVGHEVVHVGSLAWPTLLTSLGYPAYFVSRRQFRMDRHGDSWVEMHLMVPVAMLLVVAGPTSLAGVLAEPRLVALIPGLGLLSALAFSLYFYGMRTLYFSLFGLLAYLEPVLLVMIAFLLGESLTRQDLFTYVPIWLAVLVLVGEGIWRIRRMRRRQRVTVTNPVIPQ